MYDQVLEIVKNQRNRRWFSCEHPAAAGVSTALVATKTMQAALGPKGWERKEGKFS